MPMSKVWKPVIESASPVCFPHDSFHRAQVLHLARVSAILQVAVSICLEYSSSPSGFLSTWLEHLSMSISISFPMALFYMIINIINTLRFLLSVRVSVCDGCGRGRNECGSCAKSSRAFQLSQKWSY